MTLSDLSNITGISEMRLTLYEKKSLKMTEVHRIIISTILNRELSYFDEYMISESADIEIIISSIVDRGVFKDAQHVNHPYMNDCNFMENFIAAVSLLWDNMVLNQRDISKLPLKIQLPEYLLSATTNFMNTSDSFIFTFGHSSFYIIQLEPDDVPDHKKTVLVRDISGISLINCFWDFKHYYEKQYRKSNEELRYINEVFSRGKIIYRLMDDFDYKDLDSFEYQKKQYRLYRKRVDANNLQSVDVSHFFRCGKRNSECALEKGHLPLGDELCPECLGRMKSWLAWEWIDKRIDDECFEKCRSFRDLKCVHPDIAIAFIEHFKTIDIHDCEYLYENAWTYGGYDRRNSIILNTDGSRVNGNHRLLIAQRLDLKNIPYHYYSKERECDILVD